MFLPRLNTIATTRDLVDEFRGYNHNLRIGDGEFYDMKNLTSTYYPVLSPRNKRGTYFEASNIQGIIAKDNLCYVKDDSFYIDHELVDGFVLDAINEDAETEEEKHRKTLVSMGAYVVILPDKKYINTLETTDCGFIDNKTTTIHEDGLTSAITIAPCDAEGNDMDISTTKPEEPTDGYLWLDTSTKPNALKKWSATKKMWTQVATTYVRISSRFNIGEGFKEYDGVTISGLKDVRLIDHATETRFSNENISALDGNFVIQKCSENSIVVIGIVDAAYTIDNGITIERKMPDVDFLIESENRLWGCKFGAKKDNEGNYVDTVNELYACKLGDFKNWNCFMGISTDSYVASCGTDGQFTGAITHLGYPLFFKENCVHKVYGNYPANFQIQTTACRGVQKGCSNSLAIVNEVLYYKSRNAVCAYDGSLPTEISSVLGEVSYSDAVAASHGNKYYISMKDLQGEHHLFVYDTSKNLWHKEDNLAVSMFCSCRNELYYIPQDNNDIKTILGSGTVDDSPVAWMAETGIIGMYTPDKKYISRLNIRMSLDIGTKMYVYIQYDSSGNWELLSTMISTSLRSFSVPIRPRRCDHFRIRIEGEGEAKIYSFVKTLEQGSDI